MTTHQALLATILAVAPTTMSSLAMPTDGPPPATKTAPVTDTLHGVEIVDVLKDIAATDDVECAVAKGQCCSVTLQIADIVAACRGVRARRT